MSTVTTPFPVALRLLVGYVASTDRLRFAGFVVLVVVEGLLGPVTIAASGLAVARAAPAFGAGLDSAAAAALAAAVGLAGLAFAAGQLITPLRDAVATSLGSRVAQRMREQLLSATVGPPGLAHLEDPETAEEIRRAGEYEWADLAPLTTIVQQLGAALKTVISAAGAGVLLAGFAWWAPLLLILAAVGTHVWMAGNEHEIVEQHEAHAGQQRRADYFRDLALDPPAAKEVRLFGLAGWLAGRARRHRTAYLRHVWQARRANLRPVLLTLGTIAVANGAVLAALGATAVSGGLGAAELTVYVQALIALQSLGHPLLATWWVRQGAAALPHLVGLAERTHRLSVRPRGSAPAIGMPRRELRLSGVRFGYPGHDRPVLDGVELAIPAGSSLAIVGRNGEGKTTLLKLLARFYDPDEGAVRIDGTDLRDLDLASWRAQLAVIFQDFIRYELTAHQNVGFGRVETAGDPEAVRRAAERAGALELIKDLPDGWQTVLSRHYRGGVDLSGGQWQRIALARALRAADAGARLLVLDEPTAALDVRAEAALFERFLELTAGTTTVLVTHRLSSVRHVDRIAVLDRGRIAQHGTHAELMATDGLYRRMYRLQARRFDEGVHDA
ncbi:ABC transporter ATP-binding protein [Microlunatus parietis]|uniref:ATP-binding cassette subfamily B protein n=1 Tax=Microlunatus parietis TaxID=682979 RepID=A0A7Y9IF03_9ACTN|nr:ABC transporter ATP-binding protein [Microlunatus parietis]NYE75502.1 ATP-binding cassette subfamily B protein [Microlunatus parietis]